MQMEFSTFITKKEKKKKKRKEKGAMSYTCVCSVLRRIVTVGNSQLFRRKKEK